MRASAVLLVVAAVLGAGEATSAPARVPPAAAAFSIGAPDAGKLRNGVRLPAAPYLRVVPFYADEDTRWGHPALIGLVDRAAKRVARRFPKSVLGVGDISRRNGGELDRHRSHESGRDADLAFYLRDAAGKQLLADRFVQVRGDGTVVGVAGARFDDARNWALVEALLTHAGARVSHLFVATWVRARLLDQARRAGASATVRARAAEVLIQPRGAAAHDDHVHVRIGCPAGQNGACVELPTGWSSRAAKLARRAAPHAPRTPSRGATDATKPPPLEMTVPNELEDEPDDDSDAMSDPGEAPDDHR